MATAARANPASDRMDGEALVRASGFPAHRSVAAGASPAAGRADAVGTAGAVGCAGVVGCVPGVGCAPVAPGAADPATRGAGPGPFPVRRGLSGASDPSTATAGGVGRGYHRPTAGEIVRNGPPLAGSGGAANDRRGHSPGEWAGDCPVRSAESRQRTERSRQPPRRNEMRRFRDAQCRDARSTRSLAEVSPLTAWRVIADGVTSGPAPTGARDGAPTWALGDGVLT